MSFLSVPDTVRPMLRKAGKSDEPQINTSRGGENMFESVMNSRKYQSNAYEEKKVIGLVLSLTLRTKVAAIKDFEEYFFEARPRKCIVWC